MKTLLNILLVLTLLPFNGEAQIFKKIKRQAEDKFIRKIEDKVVQVASDAIVRAAYCRSSNQSGQ